MKNLIQASLNLLDPNSNILRIASPQIKYGISILLSCFWCVSFGIYTGELILIGRNIVGHILVISMVFVTWGIFRSISQQYYGRNDYELLRDPNRLPKCYDLTDEERTQATNKAVL